MGMASAVSMAQTYGIGMVSVVVLSARYADSAATINVDSPRSLR